MIPNRRSFRTISIPRSGNVLLLRYLNAYCNADQDPAGFWYESMQAENLNIPMFACRSHDRSLTDDIHITDVVNVVQFREPERQIVSYFSRMELADPGCISGLEHERLIKTLAANAAYFVSFCEKWVRPQSSDDLVVNYTELIQDPARVLKAILQQVEHDFDPRVFETTNERVAAYRIENKLLKPYEGPTGDLFRLIEPVWLATYSNYVRSRTRWMGWPPFETPVADCDPAESHAFADIADAIYARYSPR